jgi:hypothetical protein
VPPSEPEQIRRFFQNISGTNKFSPKQKGKSNPSNRCKNYAEQIKTQLGNPHVTQKEK